MKSFRRSQLLVVGIAVAVMVLPACSAATNLARLAQHPPSATLTPTPSAPPTFEISGTVKVPDYIGVTGESEGDSCISSDGYDDIRSGAQITVSDGSGTKLAVGDLDEGFISAGTCAFTFTVRDVPEGESLYDVTFGNQFRGSLTYPRADLDQPLQIGF